MSMRGGAEIIIPPFFRCPISLDLFKDPVTLWTGQTYDRSCIEKWLSAGNFTCPVTMQKLPDLSLVPNHTLKHLIHHWLHSNGYSHLHDDETDLSDNRLSVNQIKQILLSDEVSVESKLRALQETITLSQGLPLQNTNLIKLNFFRLVTELVFGNGESLVLTEKALECAVKLTPFSEIGCLNTVFRDESSFSAMTRLFEIGNDFVKNNLCILIETIALDPQTKDLAANLGKSSGIVAAVAAATRGGGECVEAGVRALCALSRTESSRGNIAAEGGVEALVECLSSRAVAAVAMAAIENVLSTEASAREAVLGHPTGVKSMVRMIFKVSEHEVSASAVNALAMVCEDSEEARERAIGNGVLTQLLLLLQSQCSGRTKNKARLLLKLLRSPSR